MSVPLPFLIDSARVGYGAAWPPVARTIAPEAGGGGFVMPANLVMAFDADAFSGVADSTSYATGADLTNNGFAWSVTNGPVTKTTLRGLPVFAIPATSVISSGASFDSSFNTACTVVMVALCDDDSSTCTVIGNNGSGLLSGLGIDQAGSKPTRFSQWFGKTNSPLQSYNVGQVVTFSYDGTGVTQSRNKTHATPEAFTDSLALSGHLDIGASGFAANMKVRRIYVFNRALTSVEKESIVDNFAPLDAGFAGNNTYAFVGDSMTGATGGTVSWYTEVTDLLDSNAVAYNYVLTDAASGWVLEQMETGIASNLAPRITPVSTSAAETAVIRGGRNNIGLGDTAAQAITKFNSLKAALAAQGFNRFVLVGITNDAADDATKTGYVTTVNSYFASLVSSSVKYANLLADARLQDPTNTTYFADGLHETDAGKAISAQIVYDALATF